MDFTTSTNVISAIDLINLSKDLAQINLGYLSIAITILVILSGVFVYFNISPIKDALNKQEEKIDALKKEASGLLKSSEDMVDVYFENFRENQKKEIAESLVKNNEKIYLEIKNQIAVVEKAFFEKIEIVSEDKDKKLKAIILSETDNKINTIEKSIIMEITKLRTDFSEKVSSVNTKISSLEKGVFDIKRSLVDFEIENHLKKNQVGAMSKMIEKLEMDIERGWGSEDTLLEIKVYITNRGMPNYYLSNLQKVIENVPKEFNVIKEEILKLAQEKIYKVGGEGMI